MPAIRSVLPTALAHEDVRLACTVVQHILVAGDMLDRLPAPALEAIRDYCTGYMKGHEPGSFSEFKWAWIKMVIDHLNDAELRERRLYQGITGCEG